MIGVLGSSGHVGSLLADMLKAKGYELRLGSRSAGFIVNMTDPSSLSRFLDGCDAVVNWRWPRVSTERTSSKNRHKLRRCIL